MRSLLGILAVAFALGSAGTAYAQTTPAPQTITKQQARYDAGAAGYNYISHLKKDSQGDWTGAGTKGDFIVTPSGKVVPQ